MKTVELTLENLGNRDTIREHSSKNEDVVKIELGKIIVLDDFNVRQEFGDLEGLAESILENGQVTPGKVDVFKNGTFAIVEGERRYRALKILEAKGHEVVFKAIVNAKKTTIEERILLMFTTQDNKQLTPVEVADLIKRLINLGHTQKTVAKKIGKTASYVSQMLDFGKESLHIKNAVSDGKINVSTVRKLTKSIPIESERVAAVQKALEQSKTKEKKNLSLEDVTGKSAKQSKAEKLAKAISMEFKVDYDALLIFIKDEL